MFIAMVFEFDFIAAIVVFDVVFDISKMFFVSTSLITLKITKISERRSKGFLRSLRVCLVGNDVVCSSCVRVENVREDVQQKDEV